MTGLTRQPRTQKDIERETWCAQLWASVMREVHIVFDLMCDTSTCWHRQWLSGRRRFGGGVVSGTRAVDHQKIGAKQSLQSLERWPQERSLTPFDHIFIVILHGPLRFREESGSGCARSWSDALGYPANQTGLARTLWSGHSSKLSFSVVFFFRHFFLHRYLEVRWCELRSIHGHRQSQQQRSAC